MPLGPVPWSQVEAAIETLKRKRQSLLNVHTMQGLFGPESRRQAQAALIDATREAIDALEGYLISVGGY